MGNYNFLYSMDISHKAVSVYRYLSDYANDKSECWPSIPRISRDLKLSQSTVRRALDELRSCELIETEQRYRPNGGKSSLLYRLKKPEQ